MPAAILSPVTATVILAMGAGKTALRPSTVLPATGACIFPSAEPQTEGLLNMSKISQDWDWLPARQL